MFNDNILPLLGSTFGTSPLSSEWIVVSIPHAGGHSMTYLPWAPEWVKSFQRLGCSVSTYAYVLPGRDGRRELKCDQSILGAAHELITHIRNLAPKKLLIYGHSMGALIAYESARGLIDRYYQKLPTAICVSGMGAPGYPNHNKTELSRLEDAELVEALLDIGQGRGASQKDIIKAFELMKTSYEHNGKLLVGGNGGSCADSEHIVGELMKGFVKRRPLSKELKEALVEVDSEVGKMLADGIQDSLRAIAITGHQGLSTAFANDVNADMTYAQQVAGYGRSGDVFLAISTSGNAKNLYYAAVMAKARGLKVILLSGKSGGKLKGVADVSIIVPENETYKIQERHLPIYHVLCLELENYFFTE